MPQVLSAIQAKASQLAPIGHNVSEEAERRDKRRPSAFS